MAKTLISSPSSFIGTPLPPLSRQAFSHRRFISTRVKFSLHELPPPIHSLQNSIDFGAIVTRAEGLLYTLADAAVALDSTTGGSASDSTNSAVQKSGGWFGFISDGMEVFLKVETSYLFMYLFSGVKSYDSNWILLSAVTPEFWERTSTLRNCVSTVFIVLEA